MRERPDDQRVVITGMGAYTPIGNSVDGSLAALAAGEHGIRYMPEWDMITDLHCRVGATVDGVDPTALFTRKQRRPMGKVAALAVLAAQQAVAQAGLDEATLRSGRTGVAFGSTSGSGSETEAFSKPLALNLNMKGLESNAYFRLMTHTCAVNVAHFFKVQGRVESTCTACTSSSQAIGAAVEIIRAGAQDVMLAGGAEEMHYTTAVTFDLLMATSARHNADPAATPRPFDRARDGLVIGEGAGAVVLESYGHATKRGADILGEVLGYASNCDGAHLTAPNAHGMQRVMELSLGDAGLAAAAIEYVNAHATGTELGDVAESQATHAIFGGDTPVSSLKGYVGHTLGACGAIELAWTLGALREGWLPPCRNLEAPDPKCAPLDYVRERRETDARVAMTNNFAFGGVNASLLLRRLG